MEILDEDQKILLSERNSVASDFLKACELHKLTIYRHVSIENYREWVEVDSPMVKSSVFENIWARVWEYNSVESGNAEYEFHLCTGSGKIPDHDHASIWFCGRIGKPDL